MLPDDVWVELVPSTQMAAWRVLEAEQNPRLRLKTDINRQLSDIISLAEAKWILPTDLIVSVCWLGLLIAPFYSVKIELFVFYLCFFIGVFYMFKTS